ncbi:hypothetical protein E8D34_06275 [Nocardioides sp. GY 10113]|uniref:hypothetical protein n=1 Tax=Nocardioides sp. GY 10113 TaxID=2569761 RepID=UPI0010A7EAA1|nr:hypothetical protein [Nocardioides sp. GY 10113]TIC87902.1 hypothetical protein E8D34_06275 [Nocardioides sp. GY 10113]
MPNPVPPSPEPARASETPGPPDPAMEWALALRDGSTTPWRSWFAAGPSDTPAQHPTNHPTNHPANHPATSGTGRRLPFLPGAQQLELLRRLNLAAAGRPLPTGMADRVLRAGSTDRGRGDLPLVGIATDGFGPPPVDPATLPAEDLLKVAAGLLAEEVITRAAPREPHTPTARWRRAPRFVGDPWATEFAYHAPRWGRAARTGGRTYLLAGDLGTLAAHAWAARTVDGGGMDLGRWLRDRITADRLPPVLDVAAHARRVADRVGVPNTVVVLDPAQLPSGKRPPAPPAVSLDALELTRLVGRPLGLLTPAAERRRLLAHHLVPRLAAHPGGSAPALSVPDPWRSHLARHADHLVTHLRRAGYPLLGSHERLVPSGAPHRDLREPTPDAVLALALDLLLDPKEDPW